MSEAKGRPLYTPESHPHAGDPRVDPSARSSIAQKESPSIEKIREKPTEGTPIEMFSPDDLGQPDLNTTTVEDSTDQNKEVQIPTGPEVKIESLTIKNKKKQRITLNEGTRDEITHIGRVYGLNPKTVIRSSPAERRDSQIVYISKPNDAFFKVDGQDTSENGLPYFWGIAFKNNGIGKMPTFINTGVVRKWDVQKKNKRAD